MSKDFPRQNSHKQKRVSSSWRRPKGHRNPQRRKEGHRAPMPNKGYRSPADERGLHPSGYEDVLVHTPADLDGLDSEQHAVRIASGVGGRKREQIAEKADDRGLKLLNWGEEQANGDN